MSSKILILIISAPALGGRLRAYAPFTAFDEGAARLDSRV